MFLSELKEYVIHDSAVAVYPNAHRSGQAVKELNKAGCAHIGLGDAFLPRLILREPG